MVNFIVLDAVAGKLSSALESAFGGLGASDYSFEQDFSWFYADFKTCLCEYI